MVLYVGSYTDGEHPEGLAAVDLDGRTGALRPIGAYRLDNPLYLAKSVDGRFLFADVTDGLASFAIGGGGELTPVDRVALGGKAMCHVAAMPDGRALTWSAYTSGEAGAIGIEGGRFLAPIRRDRHVGSGPDPRQASAHCHAAVPTPDGNHYVVADLGLDELVTYSVSDPSAPGRVFRTAPAGAGPRHLLFHPDGRHAFAVFELGSRVASYAWSPADGFSPLDSVPTLPAEWRGLNQDAAIRFTPDGRRLAVSNRGYDALTVFDFDPATGKLALRARSPLPGDWPRDFIFIPGTGLAVVALERSHTLLSLRYDAENCSFTPIDMLRGLHRPVAVIR